MRVVARLIAIALLLAAVSGLYWVDTLRRAEPAQRAQPSGAREPDYYFTGFTLREHDRAGAAGYTLRGHRLTHFADDTAGLVRPELDYRAGSGEPWRVTARNGRIGPGGGRVELIRDVVVDRPAGASSPVTLRTSRLSVFTDAGRAETDRPVTATGAGWRTRATGMTAWLERDLVELHAEVTSRYDPTRSR